MPEEPKKYEVRDDVGSPMLGGRRTALRVGLANSGRDTGGGPELGNSGPSFADVQA